MVAIIIALVVISYVACAAIKVCDAYNQTKTEYAREVILSGITKLERDANPEKALSFILSGTEMK